MGTIFESGKVNEQQKERDRLRLSYAVPKIQWVSNPTASMAIRLRETFNVFYRIRPKEKKLALNDQPDFSWVNHLKKLKNCVCKTQMMPPCPKLVGTPCPILTHSP